MIVNIINLIYILVSLNCSVMSKLVENYLLQEPVGKGVYGQVFQSNPSKK
jgi:hypothetical protein